MEKFWRNYDSGICPLSLPVEVLIREFSGFDSQLPLVNIRVGLHMKGSLLQFDLKKIVICRYILVKKMNCHPNISFFNFSFQCQNIHQHKIMTIDVAYVMVINLWVSKESGEFRYYLGSSRFNKALFILKIFKSTSETYSCPKHTFIERNEVIS